MVVLDTYDLPTHHASMARYTMELPLAVHEQALPRYHEAGRAGVLLLHGWKGFPGLMYPVFDALVNQGFSVSLPRLPGHGTTMADMLRTNRHDWMRRAMDAYADLAATHSPTYVVGHSMGGIIALLLAGTYPVERTVLLAPAIAARSKLLRFTPLVKPFVTRLRTAWVEEKERNPQFIELGREYWYYNYGHTAAELYRLQRLCRRRLPSVRGRVLTVVSESDDAVPTSVAEMIRTGAPDAEHQALLLLESDHNLLCGREQERVVQAVIDWFS